MEIGLIDVDGHNFPNLPLMKLSAWHKQHGDHEEKIMSVKEFIIQETTYPLATKQEVVGELIRCKDCIHQEKFFQSDRRRKDGGYYIYGCELAERYSHVCLDKDFCSRAERRSDV